MYMNENTELTPGLSNTPPSSPSSSSLQTPYTEETLINLITTVNELRNEVKDLMIKKMVKDEQLPAKTVASVIADHMKKNHKLGRPPMEEEIKDAIRKTKTMQQAANYIGISVSTLKRYCKFYENNRHGFVNAPLWKPTRGKKLSSN